MRVGRKRSRRAGMTLLEVLIATAILAMLAVACTPLIVRAISSVERSAHAMSVQAADLSAAADIFINDPVSFGLEHASLHEISELQIPWPKDDERFDKVPASVIDVCAIRADRSHADHLWLRFECEGAIALRMVTVPEERFTKRGDNQ